MNTVICKECGKEFKVYPYRLKRGQGKYCSLSCFGKAVPAKKTGDKHQNWKGMRHELKGARGYVFVRSPGHHRALDGLTKRCYLVAEEKLGRPLNSDEVVHHINGIKNDDRAENIEVLTRSKHCIKHNPRMGTGKHGLHT